MTHNRSLGEIIARNYAFNIGGQGAIRLLSWLFSVFVVRQLGAVEYGKYTQVIAYLAIFSVFGDMGITSYATREFAKNPHGMRALYWNVRVLRFFLGFLVMALATSCAWLLGRSPELVGSIALASVGFFFYVLQGPAEAALTGCERLDYVSVLTIVGQAIYLVCGLVVILNGYGYVGLIVAGWPGAAVFGVMAEWLLRHRLKADIGFQIDPGHWGELMRAGLPFGLSTFTNMLSFRLDTILLGLWANDAAIGHYNTAYNLIFTLLTLNNALNGALVPSLNRIYASDPESARRFFQRIMRYLLVFSLPIAVGATVLASDITTLIYKMPAAARPLQILIWTFPVLTFTSLCGSITIVFHLERPTARLNSINALANFAINLVAIPLFGILGASVATVATELVGLVQFGLLLRRDFDWGIVVSQLGRPLLAAMLMGGVVWAMRSALGLWAIGVGAGLYLGICYLFGVWTVVEVRTLTRTLFRGVA